MTAYEDDNYTEDDCFPEEAFCPDCKELMTETYCTDADSGQTMREVSCGCTSLLFSK